MLERYGKWTTVYSRFQCWRQNGTWEQIFAGLQTIKDREGQVDWEVHFIDRLVVRAHKHASGAKKYPGSRCGLSIKIHIGVDGKGQIMTFLLIPGQQHEMTVAEDLMEQGIVRRGNDQPRVRPRRVVGDKGYTSAKFRKYLNKPGIRVTIACRSNEKRRSFLGWYIFQALFHETFLKCGNQHGI